MSANREPREEHPANATADPSDVMQILIGKQKYIENYSFPYCDESGKYEKVAKIGQGTFG